MSPRVPIRAIVGRFAIESSRKALEYVLKQHPFEFCADIFGGDGYRPLKGIPEQETFVSAEIRNGHYEGVDWNAIAPLDQDLILSMTECEAVFMAMVTRLEQKRSISYLTRKLWYLRHLQFWNDYITRKRINLYLSAWIPHEIPDIVIYYLCKQRGIPVIYYDITIFRDTSFAGHDIRHSSPEIGKRYEELLAARPDGDPASVALKQPFASYEKALISPAGKPPPLESVYLPSYWQQLHTLLIKKPLKILKHAVHFVTPAAWMRVWGTIGRAWVIRKSERFYDAHTVEPDLSKPFVYLPLHYQPEAATLPMGGAYVDQILVAKLLNEFLPDDVLIYVKEHPRRSYWLNRNVAYYEDFLGLKKVRLVPKTFNTFILRETCRAIATITGSAGFEGLFRSKPTFLFGSCYYQYARGVFPIRSADDCRSAVDAIFNKHVAPTPWTTHIYLKAMQDVGVPAVLDPWYIKISKLPNEEHARVMGEAIAKEVTALMSEISTVK